jgi:hypothetical protein
MVPSTRMSLLATLLLLLCPCLVSSSSSSTPSSLSSADELLLARALLSPLGGNATAASSGGTQRALLGATDQYAWEYTSPFECGVPTDYRAVGKQKIDQLWVWGERNTGTGYTQRLFDFNLDIPNEVIGGLTWKHGFMHAQQLAASSHTVFLFMVRDLFGWLESMNRAPHHADRYTHTHTHALTRMHMYIHLSHISNPYSLSLSLSHTHPHIDVCSTSP